MEQEALGGMDRKQSFHDMVEFTFRFSCEQESLLPNPMIHKKQDDATFGRPRITSEIQKKMGQINWEVTSSKLLGVACGLVLGGLWWQGSGPFTLPGIR